MTRHSALASFFAILLADFTVRTAYLAGKSPLLPVFADELGANDILLGAIVSISTLTGLLAKPLFGFLSDKQGRWIWLLIGTTLFAVTPLLYLWVTTTSQLVGLRLVHGLATAIYGPVTLAFVAGIDKRPRAEWFGWFEFGRTGGSILGPLIAGLLLGVLGPAQVYAATSLIALIAFVPIFFLRGSPEAPPIRRGLPQVGLGMLRNRPLVTFGLVEMTSRMGVYAVKVFLPLMILTRGGSPLEAGLFLSIQEASSAAVRPFIGRLADRYDAHEAAAVCGLVMLAVALALIPVAVQSDQLFVAALCIGAGNGIYLPAGYALIARAAGQDSSGTAFGVVGALRNAGKLLGPVAGGTLLYAFPVSQAFFALSVLPLIAMLLLVGRQRRAQSVPQ